ncbi:MAG: alcohol dehydrogenase catalytic domain-containing protein, partial [Chloroflexota bacterium]
MTNTFRALVLTQDEDRKTHHVLQDVAFSDLPDGDVTVKIDYSSLNYKDGLAVTDSSPVVRSFPMIPGIDFAGTVTESSSDDYSEGDNVILTGWGVGEKHWGGYAEYARVPAKYLVKMPENGTSLDAMTIGTAGFTAMMAVMALQEHNITPDDGDILVTGASGGTGSMAIALLAELG